MSRRRESGPASTSSAGDSPARTYPPPGGEPGSQERGPGSGTPSGTSSLRSGRGSSSSRTSRAGRDDGCPRCGETCTCSDTERASSRFLPPTSGPRTSGDGSSLLPTPSASSYGTNQGGAAGRVGRVGPSLQTMAAKNLWPTPTVSGNWNRAGASPKSGDGLATAVNRWATQCSSDDHGPRGKATNGGRNLPRVGGHLNPRWIAWLMGFPVDWLDGVDVPALGLSATRSSRSAQRSSDG